MKNCLIKKGFVSIVDENGKESNAIAGYTAMVNLVNQILEKGFDKDSWIKFSSMMRQSFEDTVLSYEKNYDELQSWKFAISDIESFINSVRPKLASTMMVGINPVYKTEEWRRDEHVLRQIANARRQYKLNWRSAVVGMYSFV